MRAAADHSNLAVVFLFGSGQVHLIEQLPVQSNLLVRPPRSIANRHPKRLGVARIVQQ